MKIYYQGSLILKECQIAKSFWQRFRGLMFRFSLSEEEGLLIENCKSIHNFFMFFAIDAVFLDAENKIVEIKENLKPWISLVLPVKEATKVLEIKAGLAKKFKLKRGEKLEIRT